jgi:hypothetical protein
MDYSIWSIGFMFGLMKDKAQYSFKTIACIFGSIRMAVVA